MAKKKVENYLKLLPMKDAEKKRLELVGKRQYAKICGKDGCPHCGETGMVLITLVDGAKKYEWLEH